MSNLYDSDIPEEVLGWLHQQEEIFAIFKRWYGTELVAGGDLAQDSSNTSRKVS